MWSVCNVSCGPGGARSRKVECRQNVSSQVSRVVADNLCTGNKPASSEACNLKDCLPEWVPSNWSVVSESVVMLLKFLGYNTEVLQR